MNASSTQHFLLFIDGVPFHQDAIRLSLVLSCYAIFSHCVKLIHLMLIYSIYCTAKEIFVLYREKTTMTGCASDLP